MSNNFQAVNSEARDFLTIYLANRQINLDFYSLLSDEQLDFRMVDNINCKSDSPRESLMHQISVQQRYIDAIKTGELSFKTIDKNEFREKSKNQLIEILKQLDQELIKLFQETENIERKIKVSWSDDKIRAIEMIYSLNNHEILHTGWNLAIMDYLNIKRFTSLKNMWG